MTRTEAIETALKNALARMEEDLVQIDSEWGGGYSLEKLEADEALTDEIKETRAALGMKSDEVAHTDDLAVDRFAVAMKTKLAECRDKGRCGWDDPKQCEVEFLAKLLIKQIASGDVVDIANLSMMLYQRGASKSLISDTAKLYTAPQPAPIVPVDEPVATKLETMPFGCFHVSGGDAEKLRALPVGTKLYTAPQPAQRVPDEAESRKEFEVWAAKEFPGLEIRAQNLLGTYTRAITEWLFVGWQASRAALKGTK